MASNAPIFSAFRFQVWFTEDASGSLAASGLADAGFSEVGGLEATVDVKGHPEGGRMQGLRQLVGRTNYANVTLKRGMSRDLRSWRWFNQIVLGVHPVPRRDVLIHVLDNDFSQPVAGFVLYRAIPIKLKVSDLNAKSGELLIEEMQLAHEGMDIDLGGGL
jgi:phage tail-like protein